MKTFVIIVFFFIYNGEPETNSELVESLVECHRLGISATMYARERPDFSAQSYACLIFRVPEAGTPL